MTRAPTNTAKSKTSAAARAPPSDSDANAGGEHDVLEATGSPSSTANASADKTVSTDADVLERERSEDEEPSPTADEDEAPPLPDEIPPLPQESLPVGDDGWAPVWEETAQAFYFFNRFTGATQWTNPRVPETTAAIPTAPGVTPTTSAVTLVEGEPPTATRTVGGYDPSIHGDYDPTAWYAQPAAASDGTDPSMSSANAAELYAATGAFNRFTGRWQAAELGPENHNDEAKSRRQMNAFFDVDAAANSHDGRSLKAERSGKKLSKTELKQFKEKRKAKKEEKRRAWLRD